MKKPKRTVKEVATPSYSVTIHSFPIETVNPVQDFYDRAFLAALQGSCSVPVIPGTVDWRVMVRGCTDVARYATERRFGVKLILPSDGGDPD